MPYIDRYRSSNGWRRSIESTSTMGIGNRDRGEDGNWELSLHRVRAQHRRLSRRAGICGGSTDSAAFSSMILVDYYADGLASSCLMRPVISMKSTKKWSTTRQWRPSSAEGSGLASWLASHDVTGSDMRLGLGSSTSTSNMERSKFSTGPLVTSKMGRIFSTVQWLGRQAASPVWLSTLSWVGGG